MIPGCWYSATAEWTTNYKNQDAYLALLYISQVRVIFLIFESNFIRVFVSITCATLRKLYFVATSSSLFMKLEHNCWNFNCSGSRVVEVTTQTHCKHRVAGSIPAQNNHLCDPWMLVMSLGVFMHMICHVC